MDETIAKIRTNVLMVDDRPQNLLALEAILEPLNQNLVRAYSGEEALKHLLKTDFAVILLDVQMPVLDGFETAELIRMRDRSRRTPIVFLTALFLGWARIRSGSILGPWLVHAAANTATCLMVAVRTG